ncbi:ABC transporter ATP-binding protein [Vibrio splendidus]|uniref:Teichoic acid ABC transporter ATP-binding protein n=1 Tax=Vibrio splendidus 12E03 TaxID=1191305 RepID=A0A1E5FV21_VIBSP|nr:ABC transporter ATP-binding protein [Vibrio splendidus]OEF94376.1 teichoic acid ABC transporter ATP-binding protein [Vibrio splendidus 12E03]
MSSNIAVSVKNLTKSYHIYEKPRDRLMQMLMRGKRKYYREFSALSDISFDVIKGDSVGVLGHNGAGKSTLLQLLTGTLTASSGSMVTKGRIAALLELGAGFNPEFTGKENVYMNATILGLSKEEIDSKYDAIIAFADIGDFIGRPVKTYSSGMYVRLAFAVAVHTDPELLIIDEALAVGDIRFQMKCLKHMEQMKEKGTTVLFVSHSPEQVKRFCNKAIWLDKGKLRANGTSSRVCDLYREYMSVGEAANKIVDNEGTAGANVNSLSGSTVEKVQSEKTNQSVTTASDVQPVLPVKIISTSLDKSVYEPREPLNLTIEYEVYDNKVEGLLVGAAIYSATKEYIFGPNTHLEGIDIPNTKGKHTICYQIPKLPLLPGSFIFDVGVFTEKGLVAIDYHPAITTFTVESNYISEGLMYIEHKWKIVK